MGGAQKVFSKPQPLFQVCYGAARHGFLQSQFISFLVAIFPSISLAGQNPASEADVTHCRPFRAQNGYQARFCHQQVGEKSSRCLLFRFQIARLRAAHVGLLCDPLNGVGKNSTRANIMIIKCCKEINLKILC